MAVYPCFEGKVAVVLGGSAGIGEACAKLFAGQNCKVVVADVDEENGNRVCAEIERRGGQAEFIVTDACLPEEVERLAEKAGRIGTVCALVNCVGGFREYKPVWEIPAAEWERTVLLNLHTTFFSCREFAKLMMRQGGGAIVNVSSLCARTAQDRTPAHYSCSKAAVEALTRVLAYELGPYGVRVNAVAPGTTVTDRVIRARGRTELDNIAASIPRGRLATPEEIAGAILFMASSEAVHITGVSLDVNGGQLIV